MSHEDLIALGTATLAESGGKPVAAGLLHAAWAGAACAGPARTVSCTPGDNLAIHAALPGSQPGDVLVVEIEGIPDRGYWGEVLTTAAQAQGVAGLIITACVRDTAGLEARGFPVFATGTALPGASKVGPGAVGEPVVVGGVTVQNGDLVVADGDGVVVVEAGEVDTVRRAADERFAREQEMFERLANGETTVQLLGLDDLSQVRGVATTS